MEHSPYTKNCGTDCAVLMIHGIMGTPRHFDKFLPAVPQGWDVYNILLDGHGGTVRDFARTSRRKWREQVDTMLISLAARYKHIVIMGHSMGTLLALEAAYVHPKNLRALILFAAPLRIRLKPIAAINGLRAALGRIDAQDPLQCATRDAYSIAPDMRLWRYLAWLPRYLDLFSLSHDVRKSTVPYITTPCFAFHSRRDEMVSPRSMSPMSENPNIKCEVLEDSMHFYLPPDDLAHTLSRLEEIFRSIV